VGAGFFGKSSCHVAFSVRLNEIRILLGVVALNIPERLFQAVVRFCLRTFQLRDTLVRLQHFVLPLRQGIPQVFCVQLALLQSLLVSLEIDK